MNKDYKDTKEKIEMLLDEKVKIEKQMRTIVAEYIMRKLDVKNEDALMFGYKQFVHQEFGLEA